MANNEPKVHWRCKQLLLSIHTPTTTTTATATILPGCLHCVRIIPKANRQMTNNSSRLAFCLLFIASNNSFKTVLHLRTSALPCTASHLNAKLQRTEMLGIFMHFYPFPAKNYKFRWPFNNCKSFRCSFNREKEHPERRLGWVPIRPIDCHHGPKRCRQIVAAEHSDWFHVSWPLRFCITFS